MARRARWRRAVLLVNASLLATLLLPATAGATHHGVGVVDEVAMQLSYRSSSLAGAPGQLEAELVLDDGSPLVGATVDFWREVELLGTRRVVLGRATTGAGGTAGMPLIQPESATRVGATFAGGESYLAAEETAEIAPSGAAPPASPAPAAEVGAASLEPVSTVMPPLLALTAFAIWLLLIGLTIATVRAIRRGRSSPATTRKGRS